MLPRLCAASAGGAGGKGVWGKPGSELEDDTGAAVDAHDPNYDSDSMGNDVQLVPVTVEMTEDEIKAGDARFKHTGTQRASLCVNGVYFEPAT